MDRREERPKHELEDPPRFEALLAELSVGFISLAADRIDGGIKDAQRRVCEWLGVDRVSLWQTTSGDTDTLLLTHIYQNSEIQVIEHPDKALRSDSKWVLDYSGTPPAPIMANMMAFFPWARKRLIAGATVVFSKLDDLPADAARDKEVWRRYGSKSVLVVPLSAADQVFGVLALDMLRKERQWSEEIVRRCRLVAQIFAHAIARKRADDHLRESQARLALAADAADAGLWTLDIDIGAVWATPKAKELYGFSADVALDWSTILAVVHEDDRERVRQAVDKAVRSEGEFMEEYRVILPDGRSRWLAVRGRMRAASGEPPVLMGVTIDIAERKRHEEDLRKALEEIQQLKERLLQENIYLRKEIKSVHGADKIVGSSDAFKYVLFRTKQVAPTDSTVLLMGETGTGKGVIARHIHDTSPRKDKPFVTVNCASLPTNLIESELFGREKGAFTGSTERQMGRFELANGGSIFLDEIGEMPLELQPKLLRVIQDGEFERLGSPRTTKVNVRIIASTNCDLAEAVRAKAFREDLFYRLNVFPVTIPPLRQRMSDVPLLVEHFLKLKSAAMRKAITRIQADVIDALMAYNWPGNVRELESVVERAVITSQGPELRLAQPLVAPRMLQGDPLTQAGAAGSLRDMERQHILDALNAHGWKVEGLGGAAQALGINASTLRARMRKLGLKRSQTA